MGQGDINMSDIIQNYGYDKPLGYTQIAVLTSAVGLGTVPDSTKMAVIIPETQTVRWRDDGTNPTASVGMPLTANSVLFYRGTMSAFKVIETTATAKLNVSFYGSQNS